MIDETHPQKENIVDLYLNQTKTVQQIADLLEMNLASPMNCVDVILAKPLFTSA